MVDSSKDIKDKIFSGKQALANNYIDLAIQAFQEAINARIPEDSSQNGLIGIAQSYLLLASGIKGVQEDNSTAPQITEALNLLPFETDQMGAYIFLLMDIGKGLQEISFFKSSIIIYKKVLHYAQAQGASGDLKTISNISWNLAYSYQKVGQMEPAAKLYRIAADLEQNSEDAITLYRSSANQYYQTGMRDEALDILQTAFDKAGILQQSELQKEIAHFQGVIAFEIYKDKEPKDLSSPDIEYLDLALEKFEIVDDSDWLAKIENERSVLSSRSKERISIFEKPEEQSTNDLPLSGTITWEKESIDTRVTPIESSSPVSRGMRDFLDESTRTLDSLTKLSIENIRSEEEIEELHEADLALSEVERTTEKFDSINPYDRLFTSHKQKSSSEESTTIAEKQTIETPIPAIEEESPTIGVPKLSEVSNKLQQAGWVIHTSDISSNVKNPEPDLIAEKGVVRKKRKLIFFAEDVPDAEICSFLLQSNVTQGEKYVFLLSGNPKKAKISKKVKLVTRIDQLF